MGTTAFEREIELFSQRGGSLRMSEALRLGINRKTLYAMRDARVLESITRGLYPDRELKLLGEKAFHERASPRFWGAAGCKPAPGQANRRPGPRNELTLCG